ncbi:uncharacterized protein SPPG_03677 [Spizellomyces punctatus DAOM BR117]|uniref:DUF7719 domain-containing protein n=1 Tax=Spizellomyces punctatus (strain DAOM BR117) TaxID=645134 RepID=A0A0L0HKA3_SPIPD|nr:uncharacterized protein SPPG_03677 [Spizellomyces punctatus DAOM BR117]KND01891.1 hypothetical protein SPPG_03677 [Spizellomyces punctatus DAOM BR117]|eukprot:XP_016609930.1 hypothetical protein SPPG_03677 [Spizellomyces punctatus DAOM BR117]
MAKKQVKPKKKGPDQVSDNPPLVNLSQEEQWRIINESGVLHQIKAEDTKEQRSGSKQEEEPTVLVALLLTIPLTVLHGTLEYVVHLQYDFLQEFTWSRILSRQVPLAPVLALFIYITTRYKESRAAQAVFMLGSLASGCALIHLSQDDQTFGAMLKTPGLAILWIYFVIQAKLSYASISLLGCLLYYNRHWLQLNGAIKKLEL